MNRFLMNLLQNYPYLLCLMKENGYNAAELARNQRPQQQNETNWRKLDKVLTCETAKTFK